jgi:hypothetical protein
VKKPRLVLTLIVAAVVVTAILAAVTANSAHSLPGFRTTCDGSGCHTLTSAGTVTAIPSTTTPAAGASYNVAINIGLTSSGNTGYRITYPNTTAPTVDVQGASSASTSRTQAMTAPSAPGTYTYRVWVAKGAPSAGQTRSVTYTITVPNPAPAAPVLSSLSPVSGLAGSSVTITGTNLGTGGVVRFGTTAATVTAGNWTATRIVATVPNLTGAQTVTVTPTGAAASNGLTYTVTTPAPDGTDKTPPTTVATGVTPNGWYNHNVTVCLTATDNSGGSGVASITYSVDGGAPVTVKGSTATVTIGVDDDDDYDHDAYDHDGDDEDSRDGAHAVTYYATDVAGNAGAAKALKFGIDTHKPTTKAPYSAKAKRYHTATLKYQVNDATPNGGTAKVLIVIKSSRGDVVKMLDLGYKPVNTPLAASFTCSLRPGTYTYYVYATDTAGNRQANVAKNTLKVYSGS